MQNKWGRTFKIKIIYITGKLLKIQNEASGWRTDYTEFSSCEVCLLSLFILQYIFGNVESDPNQINLLNSQSYLQICTDYILRLTYASTEMHEQCLNGNDLRLLRTGVSRYILNFQLFILLTLVLHLNLQFYCISLLLNILNSGMKILHDPCIFACANHVVLL